MTERFHAPVPGFASTDDLDAALAAYALGAADPRERAALDAHLATCADCRRELADLQRAVSGIGASVPAQTPPPALRDRVLRAATATATATSVVSPRRAPVPAPAASSSLIAWLAAAAAIAVATASGFYAVMLRQQTTDALAQKAAADARVVQLETQAAAADARLSVMTASDVVRIDLAGQPDAPAANARVYMSPKKGMVLNAQGLPALAAGRTYQLWVVTKQAPVSIGTFSVDATGAASGVMPIVAQATIDPVAVAVTIEPDGGVPAPTGAKVLVGVLAQ